MTIEDEIGHRGYQYKHGDRPLDGYTIDRAAGRGGFGEVYYAHSDSGREVALKVVNTYEKIELRGVSQCMNLKNPHLVTIFDVRYGSDGRPWVIMEYVSGPSLRELLDAAPAGLGMAKAAFFLREIGKGLTYLHDCGIVHRDLKPGNVFYENGYVKIGDYGLSKAMSMTRHSGQTVAVGTLHYMAPEIGDGKYDRGIDIYALGALLYEMLTGQVPFFGSSPAEVLMKHLRSEVDLTGIEEPFKSAIQKAMAKNPDDRYRSVQEMVEAIFGSEAVRNSVSHFSPTSLSMMAGRAARNIGDDAAARINPDWAGVAADVKTRLRSGGEQLRRAFGLKYAPAGRRDGIALAPDRLTLPARMMMSIGAAFLAALLEGAISNGRDSLSDGSCIFFAIVSATVAATLAWRFVGPSVQSESDWVRRLALGTPIALAASPFCFGISNSRYEDPPLACCLALFLMCWSRRLSPGRKERVIIGDAISAAICAFVLSMFLHTSAAPVIAVAAGSSLAVSLFSPWGRAISPKAPAAASPWPAAAPGVTSPSATPPIPNDKDFKASANPFSSGPRGRTNHRPIPPWGIVAIVIGSLAIITSHGPHIPKVMFPVFLAFGIVMMAMHRRFNPPPAMGSGAGGPGMRSSFGQVASSAAHGLASSIGGSFLIASILLAVALVADVPGLLASSLVAPHVRWQIEQVLGTDWPRLLREFAIVAAAASGWFGLLLILVGRRWGGPAHMLRAIIATVIIFAAITSLGRGLPPWSAITPRLNTPGAIFDLYVQHIDVTHAIWAGAFYLLGWVLLVWPARRHAAVAVSVPITSEADSGKEKVAQ
jgi:hypothetical protein